MPGTPGGPVYILSSEFDFYNDFYAPAGSQLEYEVNIL